MTEATLKIAIEETITFNIHEIGTANLPEFIHDRLTEASTKGPIKHFHLDFAEPIEYMPGQQLRRKSKVQALD